MSHRWRAGWLVALWIFMLSLVAAPLWAGDNPAAEALFDEGRTLLGQKEFAAAHAKFAASHQLSPSVGALLNMGDCSEELGKLASAWSAFREASSLARERNDQKRAALATENAKRLRPLLAHLTIVVSDAARIDGLTIKRDGTLLGAALWNQRSPTDQGSLTLLVEAPGHASKTLKVALGAKADKRVTISALLAIEVKHVDDREPVVASGFPAIRIAAIATAVVGLGGIGAGIGFGLRSRSLWEDSDSFCDESGVCSQEGVDLADETTTLAIVSVVGYAAGGVALGTGVLLWFLGADDSVEQQAWVVVPVIAPSHVGAALAVAF